MRTTVTLDEDVAQQIDQRMRERGASFKSVVNELLRRGLQASDDPEPYSSPTFRLGVRPDVDIDKALALASAMDDEEVARKLERAK